MSEKENPEVLEVLPEEVEGVTNLMPLAPYDHRTLSPVETDERPLALGGMAFAQYREQLEFARSVAKEMRYMAEEFNWLVSIPGSDKPHVKVAGWSTMLAMIGVVPVAEKVELYEVEGFEVARATVQLIRTRDGARVGRGIAMCGAPDETTKDGRITWGNRPQFVKVSMALTRATGKAARLSYAWIIEMAGYSPTPAEDMEDFEPDAGEHSQKNRRIKNQWEEPVISFIVNSGLVDERREAVAILNDSVLSAVPFGDLEVVEAVAYVYGWLQTKERQPKLKDKNLAKAVNGAWIDEQTKEVWIEWALKQVPPENQDA